MPQWKKGTTLVFGGDLFAVGGVSERRGVLTTANYTARKFGVRSAMPTKTAFKLCPELVLVPVNFEKYRAESQKIRKIFKNYTSLIEPLSLDEAYLDVTLCDQQSGVATEIAREIRNKIFKETQLTASAGIAPNKFLAKVASDWKKPNGQFTIHPSRVKRFVAELPVSKIPGVGPKTAFKMNQLKIYTCRDLQALTVNRLQQHLELGG